MAAKGNRGFADSIVVDEQRATASRLPPRTGILSGRENRLAALASGGAVSRLQELVDPVRCRIWDGHNRDYAGLNETVCQDLIDSLRAQCRQEVPAIVRRVSGDPGYEYEVICGARRHWSVSWLRANGHKDFRFLIEPRELTDEEAFRIADLENRSRKDLSDYERAADYERAVTRYYDGNQGRMAERLQVSQSWLSRYLELARLPPEIIAAFGNPHALGISHAARLAPRLRSPVERNRVLALAADVQAAQEARRAEGTAHLSASDVMKRLSTKLTSQARPLSLFQHKDAQGRVMLKGEQSKDGRISLLLPDPDLHGSDEVLQAVTLALKHFSGLKRRK